MTKRKTHFKDWLAQERYKFLFAIVCCSAFFGFDRVEQFLAPESVLTDRELTDRILADAVAKSPSVEFAKAELGRKFFFDARFSKSGTVSCATCHDPRRSFSFPREELVELTKPRREIPPLINLKAASWFFWDGRADSLNQQAFDPLFNPREHGLEPDSLSGIIAANYPDSISSLRRWGKEVRRIASEAKRPASFTPAFIAFTLTTLDTGEQNRLLSQASSRGLTPSQFLQTEWSVPGRNHPQSEDLLLGFVGAIAEFEKTIVSDSTPYDAFAHRLREAKDPADAFAADFSMHEWLGAKVFFGKANCALCHQGSLFTDTQFHNIGLRESELLLPNDFGRSFGLSSYLGTLSYCLDPSQEGCAEREFLNPDLTELVGAFKTPTLRNLRDTAPYFHNGSAASLDEVIDHYTKLRPKPSVGEREETLKTLLLTQEERKNLIAFLLSLSGPTSFLGE